MAILQKRPLSTTGGPVAIALGGTIVHTLDASAVKDGGAYMDEVTLFLHTAGAATFATVTAVGLPTFDVAIAANGILRVFFEQAFRSSGGTITVARGEEQTEIIAWGWFTRS